MKRETNPTHRQKRSVTRVALATIAVVSVMAIYSIIALGFVGAQVSNTFYPGMSVAGVSVGSLNTEEAKTKIENVLTREASRSFVFKGDTAQWSFVPSELGLSWDIDAALEHLTSIMQESETNPLAYYTAVDVSLPVSLSDVFITTFATIQRATDTPAVDASLLIDTDVRILPETNGSVIDATAIRQEVADQASHLMRMPISLTHVIALPDITVGDLTDPKLLVETMLARPVVITHNEKTWQVGTGRIAQWITLVKEMANDNGAVHPLVRVDLDDTAIADVFLGIADEVNINPETTIRIVSEARDAPLAEGEAGQVVDVPRAVAFFKEAALDRNDKGMELPVVTVPSEEEILDVLAPKTEGKVISVDVAKQIAYAHEDGVLKDWARVSTGRKGYDTPVGEWHVYSKTPIQSMSGPGYYLPGVKWVMAYNGDYTLHTAYWHNNFGTPMSHGCTNMREEDAKWFYDWAEVGTPVVIYSST